MEPVLPAILAGEARERLRARLRSAGFDEVRFARVGAERPAGLREWLAAGNHADMAWLERTAGKRMNADLVLPGARSVIILGVNYANGDESAAAPAGEPRPPVWARYALHDDYHDTIKPGLVAAGRMLEDACGLGARDYRYYVDTGPVLERGWAARSGLGFLGKNGMLISKRHGNWLFLATILVRAEIEPDAPLRKKELPADGAEPAGLLCGKCTRCLDACPTAAITAPGVVDARRCISYQTIENKGVIPRGLRAGIGRRIYGCDVCLEVCPWNRFAQAGHKLLLAARGEIGDLSLREILELTPARFAAVFRRTAIKRLKLAGLLRNACVVAGNSGEAVLLPPLARLAAHESPLVRAHAVWAVRRLAGEGAAAWLGAARARETEASVLVEYGDGA
ncbi:MAG: tRNA epoxyqueuosine(34) reductase QueG [Opitutae bacterium]|nr:tRNA epoxyqueuosine(34) reductase QueG [Opitutae bacterium]